MARERRLWRPRARLFCSRRFDNKHVGRSQDRPKPRIISTLNYVTLLLPPHGLPHDRYYPGQLVRTLESLVEVEAADALKVRAESAEALVRNLTLQLDNARRLVDSDDGSSSPSLDHAVAEEKDEDVQVKAMRAKWQAAEDRAARAEAEVEALRARFGEKDA